jgi:hypothetical protein
MKFVVTMRSERRSAERREVNLGTTIADDAEQSAVVLVDDISAAGFRMVAAAPVSEGDVITLELPRVGRHVANVVWQEGVSFGCTFATPITASDLAQIVEDGAARQALQQERASSGWRPDAAALAA